MFVSLFLSFSLTFLFFLSFFSSSFYSPSFYFISFLISFSPVTSYSLFALRLLLLFSCDFFVPLVQCLAFFFPLTMSTLSFTLFSLLSCAQQCSPYCSDDNIRPVRIVTPITSVLSVLTVCSTLHFCQRKTAIPSSNLVFLASLKAHFKSLSHTRMQKPL